MKCAPKQTVSHWRQTIKLIDAGIDIDTLKHTQPSHAYEIVSSLDNENEWPEWVARCENDKLTIIELRSALMAKASEQATKQTEGVPYRDTTSSKRIYLL